jgi:hypothetical protein
LTHRKTKKPRIVLQTWNLACNIRALGSFPYGKTDSKQNFTATL